MKIYLGIFTLLIVSMAFTGCIDIGDEARDPREGDLSLTIHMDQSTFNTTPDSIKVQILLENDCPDVILIEKYLILSATLSENITCPDGNKIGLWYDLLDYQAKYSDIEPGENISEEIDLVGYGSEIWVEEGQYSMYFVYGTHKKNGGYLSVRSNTITFLLTD